MRILLGILLLPVWVVGMLTVYPFCWIGARMWHLMTGDDEPLNKVSSWGWAHR